MNAMQQRLHYLVDRAKKALLYKTCYKRTYETQDWLLHKIGHAPTDLSEVC